MTAHPAKFAPVVLARIQDVLDEYVDPGVRILDPFAGVGGIHSLKGYRTVGVELEPEWVAAHEQTEQGDATKLRFRRGTFDVIATSPCYGNRMADHHDARDTSKRHTYKHYLGHNPSENSAAVLQWGPAYRQFHEEAIREATRVSKEEALFVLNMSDHWRSHAVQPVTAWWVETLTKHGWLWVDAYPVNTRRQLHGEHADKRVDNEWVLVFRRTKEKRK